MPISNSKDPCTICTKIEPIMHSHHTVPRSRGGENSLQIQLCPTCHNLLHANAVALVAQIRNNRTGTVKNFFVNPDDNSRAQPYLKILVIALIGTSQEERRHTVTASIPTDIFFDLKILQQDLGLSSLEKTMEFCIVHTLNAKGVRNEKKKLRESSMWFMHVPK